ncbi:5-oxoprolinase subunit PxpB [Horticoccus sp. 23ND18S-11]|uniref:5-oxoprolinase subunit PxpB n=1 Tax=Horticoccus sp. 23ND18S-11 TaxID=3391832 RepID=UPI0039C8CD7C
MTVAPLGDSAVMITLGESVDPLMAARVRAIAAEIERHPPVGVTDVVPAFASVAVFFEPAHARPFEAVCAELQALVDRAEAAVVAVSARRVEIPVCYGGDYGPDLHDVAARARLTPAQAAALHAGAEYLVHAVGFSPGFPYLGGLPAALATPRLATPRSRVPAGSVGIGGGQTGVYPIATPGGWNLIGRTPRALFDARRPEPALLQAGDRVVFRPISADDFAAQAAAADVPTENAAARPTGSGIHVVRAGMFTTVQDAGRRGHRSRGVPQSGAADALALRLVNLLVGNPEGAAALEFTLVGPELRFDHDTVVAIGGGDFGGDVPRWRPIEIRRGTTLKFGAARHGCRGYLAAAGGIDVAPVLGSRSTYVRAELGGFHGRALRDGDDLPVPDVQRHFRDHWRIDERILPSNARPARVRVVRGGHADQFAGDWIARSFTVSPQSDRMGLRLQGAALERRTGAELVSAPVAPGTIQVPPDGQPIVLLADAQTIGGYPRLAHVIAVDLPRMAQLRPGETVTFCEVSLAEARDIALAQERALALLREGLAQKLA